MELPRLTRAQIEHIASDAAINQQIEKMRKKGLIPAVHDNKYAIAADVVDAVRWFDQKNSELRNLKTQDIGQKSPWIDDLLEDFVAFDVCPGDSEDSASNILKGLRKQLEDREGKSAGPEQRNYLHALKRELELLLDKM